MAIGRLTWSQKDYLKFARLYHVVTSIIMVFSGVLWIIGLATVYLVIYKNRRTPAFCMSLNLQQQHKQSGFSFPHMLL